MRKHKHYCVVSLLLAALLSILPCTTIAAENQATVTVNTYSDADNQQRPTTFLLHSDELYISAEDALALSGYCSYSEDYGKAVFTYRDHSVEFKSSQINYAGTFYYPLRQLMDVLATSYHYESSSDVLIFITCRSYYENLLADCNAVFDGGYQLNFLDGTGWQVAGVYEIIAGLQVDMFWGGYQQELYEDTLAGIILHEESEAVETLKQGDSIMQKLSTLLKYVQKDINNTDTYMNLLGADLDKIIEAYDKLNSLVPGISINDALEILGTALSSMDITELYPNAIKFGLVENPYIKDPNLVYAASSVYSLYDKNKDSFEVVVTSLLTDVLQEAIENYGEETIKTSGQTLILDLIKEFAGENYNKVILNTAYIKLAKLLFDEMGMKERSTAIMQTIAARNIQHASELQFSLSNGEIRYIIGDDSSMEAHSACDPMRTKYSTILYLRACQYAYSLYAFDPELSYWSSIWCEKTAEAINTISAYSDEELTRTVSNPLLSVEQIKPYSTDDENTISPPLGDRALFDNTYWDLGFGQTMGSNFEAQFYTNGTFLAAAYAGWLSGGTYEYEDGILIITFESYADVPFEGNENGFTSIFSYPMQEGEAHYTITPSDGSFFCEYYSANDDEETAATEAEPTKTLPDGKYNVKVYNNGSTQIAGCNYETFDLLEFVEISNEEALSIEVGDTIKLPDGEITVSNFDFVDEWRKMIRINDGQYLCYYIEESNVWRFMWPSYADMTYCTGTYTIAAPAPTIIDKNTVIWAQENIYGDKYSGETENDDPIFKVLSLSDYFSYTNFSTEHAIITIENGIISEIFIQYNP